MRKKKRQGSFFPFRSQVTVIVVGLAIAMGSWLFTNHMAGRLRTMETSEVELWSYAMTRLGEFDRNDPIVLRIIDNRHNIPFIMTDERFQVITYNRIPEKIINHPDWVHRTIEKFSTINQPIDIMTWSGSRIYMFYGKSDLLTMLVYFPFVQLSVIVVFVMFGFITFRSSKQDEQHRVWIGLAKETAHQLGTPTSSLLGWIEYLRSQPIDQTVVEEMDKDLTRLTKVIDRFSKIGSETLVSERNVNELVGNSVLYFRSRIPKNVTLEYNGLAIAPVSAMINEALFEWVVENLLKNALDALQGRGEIKVRIADDSRCVYVEVSDTGKGIPKGNVKRIFDPGFTTKTRGWGLGLSLSRRIIEEYHHGKIGVLESEEEKGTTIRITLKKPHLS